MMPKISVIIAVYNTAAYLDKCIQSVLSQTFTEWELVCVDDGSTDESYAMLQAYAVTDSRIKVYQIPHCGIHAKVMNVAVDYTTAPYIFSLDSDDYLSSNCLQVLYNRIESQNADICLANSYLVEEDGTIISKTIGLNGNINAVIDAHDAVLESLYWNIHSRALCKRSYFTDIRADENGFSIEYTIRERYNKCKKMVFADGIYYYVNRPSAITKRIGPRLFYYVLLDKKVLKLLKENDFEHEVIVQFETECLKNLFYKGVEFVKRCKQLDMNGRVLSNGYLREAFEYYQQDHALLKEASGGLSKTKRYILFTRSYSIYQVYCWIKSFS